MTTNTITLPAASQLAQFDEIYTEARAAADPTRVPWNDGAANPHLVRWLNQDAREVLRCGSRVAVVGCGLGHDARELLRRGYEVTAFDVSPTAVAWARQLDPDNASHYLEANVLDPPTRWIHRFDLVVEINTIQSLPPACRPAMVESIGRLVGMRGHLLVICHGAEAPVDVASGPPWALTERELIDLADVVGLHTDHVERIADDETPPKLRFRALFHRD